MTLLQSEFTENFKKWVDNYNNDYPHFSLNYSTPSEYEKGQLLLTTLTSRSPMAAQCGYTIDVDSPNTREA